MKTLLIVLCFTTSIWFLGVSRSVAHTFARVDQVCPLCQTKFTATLDASGTRFGMRLDLKPIGPIAAPWAVAVCPTCKFALFKSKDDPYTEQELKQLRELVASDAYKGISEKDSSYFRLAKIYECLKKPARDIAHIYLQASWQVENDDKRCEAYLSKCLENFDVYLGSDEAKKKDENWQTAAFLRGELLRRLGRFDDAKKHFAGLNVTDEFKVEPYPKLIKLESELIDAKDRTPHEVPREKK